MIPLQIQQVRRNPSSRPRETNRIASSHWGDPRHHMIHPRLWRPIIRNTWYWSRHWVALSTRGAINTSLSKRCVHLTTPMLLSEISTGPTGNRHLGGLISPKWFISGSMAILYGSSHAERILNSLRWWRTAISTFLNRNHWSIHLNQMALENTTLMVMWEDFWSGYWYTALEIEMKKRKFTGIYATLSKCISKMERQN